MQLRKQFAPRCHVDDAALELMQRIAIIKCNKISDVAKSRRRIVSEDRILLNQIMPLAKGEPRAIEQLKADLCGLPYKRITVAESPQVKTAKFLHGVTRTIIVDLIDSQVRKNAFDIGEYDVYINQHIFNGEPINNGMHFVPQRAPTEPARHWHHRASLRSSGYYEQNTPLDANDFASYSPSTCMNTYGAIFGDLCRNLSFAEFLRIINNFLSHYYYASPLCHPSDHIVRYL